MNFRAPAVTLIALAALAAGSITTGLFVAKRWLPREVALSAAPAEVAAGSQPANTLSVVTLHLRMPFASLQEAIDQALPLRFDLAGTGRKTCVKLPLDQKICGTPQYQATVAREGAVQIGGSGDQLTVNMPIGITGEGGVGGHAGKLLQLSAKKFHASMLVTFNAVIDLDQNWCPVLQGTAGYRWIDPPRVEVLGGVWLDVSSEVSKPLQTALASAAGNLPRAIGCDRVRGPIAKAWRDYAVPVRIAGAPELYLHVAPAGMGFSGLTTGGNAIDLTARLTARTSLLATSATGDAGPLPQLARIADGPGAISVMLPIHAPYGLLDDIAMRAAGQRDFKADGARVRISSVSFYPSGDRLVARIGFTARAPGHWFDTSGVVYLSGVPMVSADGRMLRLTNVGFSRILDNALWSGLSVLFEGQIKDAITQAAVFDLGGVEAKAGAAVKTALADRGRTGGIALEVGEPKVGLASVRPAKDELIVLTTLQAPLSGELNAVPIPKLPFP